MRWAALLTLVVCLGEGAEVARIAGRGQELTILFGGDSYFGETYEDNRKRLLRERGYDYSLERLKPLMALADFSVLNLETPICRPSQSSLEGKKPRLHWGHIMRTTATLQSHGVRLVTLANNHALDYGVEGLRETFEALRRHQMEWIGAGMDSAEAGRPWVAECRIAGRQQYLGMLSAFEYHTAYRKVFHFYATAHQPGVARLEPAAMMREIQSLKAKYPGIFIVAFPHWGKDYEWKDPKQTDVARRLIDAGADLILGHGAHRLQEMELYRQRWILHGLGNFVFNSPGRYEETKSPPYSLVALLTFRASGPHLKLYPILSDNHRTAYQPRPLTAVEFADALSLLHERGLPSSARIGEDNGGRLFIEWLLATSLPVP